MYIKIVKMSINEYTIIIKYLKKNYAVFKKKEKYIKNMKFQLVIKIHKKFK